MTEQSDIERLEKELLRDADSISNTIGPMVLPLALVFGPIGLTIIIGIAINVYYYPVQPLIGGFISPAYSILLVLWALAFRHWFKSGQGAWKPEWMEWRYWRGELHTDLQLKIKEIKFVGKAAEQIVMKKGEDQPRKLVGVTSNTLGFVERPKTEKAGDYIYEFWFKSKPFPLAIVALPYTPEEMLNFVGNYGIVLNGGFIWGTERIAAVDFVRTGFTQTREIPYVPIGVFGFYAKRAIEIRDDTKEKMAVAVQLAAGVRDTFHAVEWQDKAEAEGALRKKIEKLERNFDKEVEIRLGEALKQIQKSGNVKIPGHSSKVASYGWLIAIAGIVAGVILFLRFG